MTITSLKNTRKKESIVITDILGGVSKSMLTLNEAIIDVKKG